MDNLFYGLSTSEMRDLYNYYVKYRESYCRANETCAAEFGIVEFYGL